MAMHLAAYLEDLDSAGVFANIAALDDNRLFTQGDDLRVPALNQVIMLAGGADNAVAARMRLNSPTLDALVRHEIVPLNQATGDVEPGSPPAIQKMLGSPLILGVDEILTCDLNNDPGAVADQWCLVWFSDGPVQPVAAGNIFTVRATSATALVARVWSTVNINLDENLPPGDYAVVGLRAESASMIAARVVFRTGEQWRPGTIGCDLPADLTDPVFRAGALGIWGEFPFTQLPAMECLADLADAAQIFHIDLIRVR